MKLIPFNKPYMTGKELSNIAQAHMNGHLAGNGAFTKKCQSWFEETTGCRRALLTHSCTSALEMAALLADIQPGDEIILPSYTFVSTANVFVGLGGVPVFVDIREDTLNIDESKIEAAITSKTRAIVPVHYAGVGCEMATIMKIAKKHNLLVIEDAAQGVMSEHSGQALGAIGHMGAYSFHETKNIISGEGGALLINSDDLVERAAIVWEKGTNRGSFYKGQTDKYTWVDKGSSFLPGEIVAAFLHAQIEEAVDIVSRRIEIWSQYHEAFAHLERQGKARGPVIPENCKHNAHMYYLLMPDLKSRVQFISAMKAHGVHCVFHYVPLHSSPAGLKYGRVSGDMLVTDDISDRLVRLPLWLGIEDDISRIIDLVKESI